MHGFSIAPFSDVAHLTHTLLSGRGWEGRICVSEPCAVTTGHHRPHTALLSCKETRTAAFMRALFI